MAKLTLAQQLAQISEPAPQDFDPEDSYATYADGRTAPAADSAAHADYVDVGVSQLRKKGEAVLDAKYGGTRGSRAKLYGAGDEDDEDDEEEEEEEEDEASGVDEDDDDEMGDFEDLEAGEGASDDDDDQEEDDEDQDEEDEAPTPPAPKARSAAPKSHDERAMVKQLRQAASADVEKGRDVKKQLAFCDSLLEARIKLQKAVGAANRLPPPRSGADAYFAQVGDEVGEVRREVDELGEELFALRESLLAKNEKLELPSDFGASRKRKRASSDEGASAYLDQTLSDLRTLEVTFDPFLRSTISKWSDKVLAASGLSLAKGGGGGADKKFKAVNQNALAQIDHALSGAGERDRLVRRTRVRRAEGDVVGAVPPAAGEGEVDVRDKALAGEEGKGAGAGAGAGAKDVDDECFDDSDFYQQLLRDVVESRMLDLDDATMTQLRQATAFARGKKVKKQVDTRASKGRKIRYHVHEKAQNFMIPIEAGNWHEEQIDELFASLLGRSFAQDGGASTAPDVALDPALDDVAPARAGEIEVGSLRLF
ncbi:hypothetical protein Rhopal_003417-T1 [Rhodotorula paludigena]|uniref:Protein BFR2 n=1 Tax=Rhodotorula paludigena TaxID=86838 RepID=A0AAV5GCW8_9BASI|nr:hypothetical protein Rhopal_003417-T1 [Rhodotorula paludigena]